MAKNEWTTQILVRIWSTHIEITLLWVMMSDATDASLCWPAVKNMEAGLRRPAMLEYGQRLKSQNPRMNLDEG